MEQSKIDFYIWFIAQCALLSLLGCFVSFFLFQTKFKEVLQKKHTVDVEELIGIGAGWKFPKSSFNVRFDCLGYAISRNFFQTTFDSTLILGCFYLISLYPPSFLYSPSKRLQTSENKRFYI